MPNPSELTREEPPAPDLIALPRAEYEGLVAELGRLRKPNSMQLCTCGGIVGPQPAPGKRGKYRNVVSEVAGLRFDSKAEARHYLLLKQLEQAGEITELKRQVPFRLEVNGHLVCTYKADFTYREKGTLVVCDVKGYPTPEYALKRKLMAACHGITIHEVRSKNVPKKRR